MYYKALHVLDAVVLTFVIKDDMWPAGQTLAKIIDVVQFELSKRVEEVYEKAPDSGCVTSKGRLGRFKLQRTE